MTVVTFLVLLVTALAVAFTLICSVMLDLRKDINTIKSYRILMRTSGIESDVRFLTKDVKLLEQRLNAYTVAHNNLYKRVDDTNKRIDKAAKLFTWLRQYAFSTRRLLFVFRR